MPPNVGSTVTCTKRKERVQQLLAKWQAVLRLDCRATCCFHRSLGTDWPLTVANALTITSAADYSLGGIYVGVILPVGAIELCIVSMLYSTSGNMHSMYDNFDERHGVSKSFDEVVFN
jgi:hypothetical protein